MSNCIEKFEQLKNKYKIICEFEETKDGFKPIKDTPMMIDKTHKRAIYPYSEDVYVIQSVRCRSPYQILKSNGVELFGTDDDSSNSLGESVIEFSAKDIHIVAEVLGFKKAQTNKIIYSVGHLNTFLRYMRNFHDKYGVLLEKNIEKNRKKSGE